MSHRSPCRLETPFYPSNTGLNSDCHYSHSHYSSDFLKNLFIYLAGLISFRMGWFDLLAVQGTLKSLLQHQCSKASVLWQSAFFMVQLSCRYMTTGKAIALTKRTFVSKVMSLLFNTLSRFVIVFLPRSKCLLISWVQVSFKFVNPEEREIFSSSQVLHIRLQGNKTESRSALLTDTEMHGVEEYQSTR